MLVSAVVLCRSHQEHSDPLHPEHSDPLHPVAYFVLDDDWSVTCSLHHLPALDYCFIFTSVLVENLRYSKMEINQTIKTDLYTAMFRKRMRGARWQGLGGVSSVKQFRL